MSTNPNVVIRRNQTRDSSVLLRISAASKYQLLLHSPITGQRARGPDMNRLTAHQLNIPPLQTCTDIVIVWHRLRWEHCGTSSLALVSCQLHVCEQQRSIGATQVILYWVKLKIWGCFVEDWLLVE